ncbi:MAG: hypothetical protein MJ082_04765, partial [Clostridia bacterium]|nr:hypothetical protein [Clostridia bacterium]
AHPDNGYYYSKSQRDCQDETAKKSAFRKNSFLFFFSQRLDKNIRICYNNSKQKYIPSKHPCQGDRYAEPCLQKYKQTHP